MHREVRLFDELDRFAAGHEISHALALTYGYDGDIANERIWNPLVEKYGLRHPLVIADGKVNEGKSLGVHVLRARRQSGVFHPKLFLAVRENAVFVAVGSANLTRGGLGANLELMTPLIFDAGAQSMPPRGVLESILAFVERVLGNLRIANDSRDKAADVVHHAKQILAQLPEQRRAINLQFLHSYDESIWEQLCKIHGDDPLAHLLVVSPFFEVDDPDLDESDSLLRHALRQGLPWAARPKEPRCSIHLTAFESGMALPLAALQELGAWVELRPQMLSSEPRRLHAKLMTLFGKTRTTLLWGSPNFTPAGLLRAAGQGGNIECALVLSVASGAVESARLNEEFNLGDIFQPHHGQLPEARIWASQTAPIFEVGEVLYDPATRVLSVFGESFSADVQRIRVRLAETAAAHVLIDGKIEKPGAFSFSAATQLEEEDAETGKRRLSTLTLFVEVLDNKGVTFDQRSIRINVRFDDALEVRANLLLYGEAVTADALLVSSNAPPEERVAAIDARIAAWAAARKGNGAAETRHHASLDAFFRNIRYGLDGRWAGLSRRRGSRFALLRWSRELSRALLATASDGLDGARQLYLVVRIAEHIEQVIAAIPTWHPEPLAAYSVIEPEKLAEKLAAVRLDAGLATEELDEVRAIRDRVTGQLRRLSLPIDARRNERE